LFAFSSLLAWSYYGLKGWTYLFGESRAGQLCFQLLFCGFIVIGCMLQLKAVLDFSDAMIFVIAIPNLIALYLFAPEVKADVTQYIQKLRSDARY
jgi:AGCS family alanine or glycine:cation symporter